MKIYKSALFDLDGTLVDNYSAIHMCLDMAFSKEGIASPDYEQVYRAVGGSILITIKKLLPQGASESSAIRIGEEYMRIFPEYMFCGLKPMPWAKELLAKLGESNIKLACFTNKQQEGAEEILKKLDLDSNLSAVIGTSLHSARKPSKEFTQYALKCLGVDAQDCVGVGDSPYDYAAADACKMDCALVATGADSAESLKARCVSALGVFSNLKELGKAVFNVAL